MRPGATKAYATRQAFVESRATARGRLDALADDFFEIGNLKRDTHHNQSSLANYGDLRKFSLKHLGDDMYG